MVAFLPPLAAQNSGTGAVLGTVRDASDAVLPAVAVKITHAGTGESRETVTDPAGDFFIGLLQPGPYRLEFSFSGFKTLKLDAVLVEVADRVAISPS